MAAKKFTLLKTEYTGPEITKYVLDTIKSQLEGKTSASEDQVKDVCRKVRLALSKCKSEVEMIACGETLLQDINAII